MDIDQRIASLRESEARRRVDRAMTRTELRKLPRAERKLAAQIDRTEAALREFIANNGAPPPPLR